LHRYTKAASMDTDFCTLHRMAIDGRGLHSFTFQLNLSRF